MSRSKKAFGYIKEKYELLSVKKYTTIAGTLVFFLIMSIVPLSFWLTLVIGKLPVSTDKILALPVFDSVKEVLQYVQKEASNATAGASVILIITTLYSSTNLFYQMRRSGEIIYDYHQKREGLKLRFGALILLTVIIASTVILLLTFAVGSFLFSRLLPSALERVVDYLFLLIVAFLLALLLNVYICPFQENIRSFLPGTLITVGAWAVAALGFSAYLKISNMTKLYGALSTVIVFLLWLYVLMICFIVGVIFNSEKILRRHKKAMRIKGIKTKSSRKLHL